MNTARNPWLSSERVGPRPKLRLLCFPHAGGSAVTAYKGWLKALGSEVEVRPVLLPGRDHRIQEPAVSDLMTLAAAASEGIRPALDTPFALFGHSMGGLLAFEVARLLASRHGLVPAKLYVSAYRAPHLPYTATLRGKLPREELIREIRAMEGTPPEVFHHRELVDLILPIFRADFTACETYRYVQGPPLECPITALGGEDDDSATEDSLQAWQQHTRGPFQVRRFPGGHFFLQTARESVQQLLAQDLLALLAARGTGP